MTLPEFKELDGSEVCRRYNFGDWLDYWQDTQAEKAAEDVLHNV